MSKPFKVYVVIVALAFVGSLGALIWLTIARPKTGTGLASGNASAAWWAADPLARNPNLIGMDFPEFELVDQDARPVTRSIFEGNVTIVGFQFTYCRLACPIMFARIKDARERLRGVPVRFASISIDPEHDTPTRLKEHAQQINADLSRWTFITEPAPAPGQSVSQWARKLLNDRWRVRADEDPNEANRITLPDGKVIPNLIHPSFVYLVGPDAKVIARYNVGIAQREIGDAEQDQLIAHAKAAGEALAKRGPSARTASAPR
jgi:cytochrome oxidase Cu insertion factor (SCO1/SenC/PrrC family)